MVVRINDFTLLSALKARSELAFVAGITRIILTKEHDLWYEGPDILVLRKSMTLCNVSLLHLA